MTTVATNRYVGTATRNEVFNLGGGPNYIDGGAGNDFIYPFNANDFVIGGTGSDLILTLGGDDVIFADNFAPNALDGDDFVLASGGSDVVFAGGGNDFVAGDDTVAAGTSNDFVDAGAGTDTVWGYAGSDTILGGTGNDLLFGHAPTVATTQTRTLFYDFNGVTDAVEAGSFTTSIASNGADDNAADLLEGGDGSDTLVGNGGGDILYGGRDDDQLDGSAGGDWLDGGGGVDLARYDGSTAGVVVRLDVGFGSGGDAAGDNLISIEGLIGSANQDFLIGGSGNEYLFGQAGDDWLFGQGGSDYLYGSTGSDQLIGGAGNDFLYGETGNDQFWFLAADFAAGGVDRIFDFGESLTNFDYLRFEGISAASLTFTDGPGFVQVDYVLGGSIFIFGVVREQLADQIIYA